MHLTISFALSKIHLPIARRPLLFGPGGSRPPGKKQNMRRPPELSGRRWSVGCEAGLTP